MYVHDPEPELEPEPEPYSDNMSEPEPSSNFPVPQPWKKERRQQIQSLSKPNLPTDGCGKLKVFMTKQLLYFVLK
jgi:hypothetical protein